MTPRIVYALFELAPLAPIAMITPSQRLTMHFPDIDDDNPIYQMIHKDIQSCSFITRAYWGLNADLEQAEKTAENVVKMALEEDTPIPFQTVLVPTYEYINYIEPPRMPNSVIMSTPRGAIKVTERGGATYYKRI